MTDLWRITYLIITMHFLFNNNSISNINYWHRKVSPLVFFLPICGRGHNNLRKFYCNQVIMEHIWYNSLNIAMCAYISLYCVAICTWCHGLDAPIRRCGAYFTCSTNMYMLVFLLFKAGSEVIIIVVGNYHDNYFEILHN